MTAVAKKEKPEQQPPAKRSNLGLDSIGDLSSLLSAPKAQAVPSDGRPIRIPLALIDEGPNPRTAANPGFSQESIAELASSIGPNGVKSPISVRENPEVPGRYLINHGARRYRATIVKGHQEIPAFIDNDYSEDDQVIENIQRNELTAREIADYIGSRLARGLKKQDIAASLGKSNAFVSQHVTLLDLPEPIAAVFNAGRVRDVTVINDLVKAHKKDPAAVVDWLEDETIDITRGSVALLREFMESKGGSGNEDSTPGAGNGASDGDGSPQENHDEPGKEKKAKAADPAKLKKAIVQVRHNERPARLLLDRRPSEVGLAWLKYEEDGQELEIDITSAQLVAIVEA